MERLYTLGKQVGRYRPARFLFYRVAGVLWPLFSPVKINRSVKSTPIKFQLQTPYDFELLINDIDVEKRVLSRFLDSLKSADVVYDIGSNIGTYAILAHNKYPNSRVIAFEPNPENITNLRNNAEANEADIDIRQIALSDSVGSASFRATSSKTGRLAENKTEDSHITVDVSTGDMITEELSVIPTIMKIDVEGEELRVLKGLDKTLSEQHLREIFVEIHESNHSDFGLSESEVSELKQYLQQKGFRLTQIDETSETHTVHAVRE